MGSNTITVCSSFLIFVLLTSVFAFPASQNNGFLAYADTGDISDDLLDDIVFNDGGVENVAIAQINRGVVAVLYEDDDNDEVGVIETWEISRDGTIGEMIDSLVFEPQDFGCNEHMHDISIVRAVGDVYAIAYVGDCNRGLIATVNIGSNGRIGDNVLDELVFEGPDDIDNDTISIVLVSRGVVAVAYQGADNDGFVKTFRINSGGTITLVDTLEFDGDQAHTFFNIIKVRDGIYAIPYEDDDHEGRIITIGISSTGDIADAIISSLKFETGEIEDPLGTLARDGVVAIVYEGDDDDEGILKTVLIDSDGTITLGDDLEFLDNVLEDHHHLPIDIITVANGVVAIVYKQEDTFGSVRTFEIASDGTITIIDLLEFDVGDIEDPRIACANDGIAAIAMADNDGFILTVGIEGNICVFRLGGGGSDASEYLTKPTFGLDHKTGIVQVEGGFIVNGKVFDVTDNWHTDFEKQAILVGQTNSFSAKAFAPHVINVVEFMFGIPEVGFAHMAEASIEVTIDRDQNVINVQVNQNGNLIDPASVTATAVMAQCKSGDTDNKCYFITVSGVFNEALMNDIFALKGIDFLRHFHLTYLNEGFTIFGNSLNPATTLFIASNVKGSSGLMEVTQIDKEYDMWVDKSGIEYERNSFDSFIRTTPVEVVRDDPMVKVMTRMNSNFEAMKQYELDKATAIFDSSLIQKELPDSYSIQSSERSDKLQDPEVQLKLFIERMRADDKMNQLMQMWYAKPNPNQLN